MTEFVLMDEIRGEGDEMKESNEKSVPNNKNSFGNMSPRSLLSPQGTCSASHAALPIDGAFDTGIEQLYENVCDMQSSSDQESLSRQSFGSYGEDSRINSELQHLVGVEIKDIVIMEKEEVEVGKNPKNDGNLSGSSSEKENLDLGKSDIAKSRNTKTLSLNNSKRVSRICNEEKSPVKKPDKRKKKNSAKKRKGTKVRNETKDLSESELQNLELGRSLLEQAKNLMTLDENNNHEKALELALQAGKSFESCANGKPNLELVMCLHITASIYDSLGRYSEAIAVLKRSVQIPVFEEGEQHVLAKFAGLMQLGDAYATLGQLEISILSYTKGLEIQRMVLGENDPRVGETCRYIAEAHVQALQFNEAENLCKMAIDIHRVNNSGSGSLEEMEDLRLMGLICESMGDNENALKHLILATDVTVGNVEEIELAFMNRSIGDAYLFLSRYDEAVICYEKALAGFESTEGENHPVVGSVYTQLANVFNRMGKLRKAKSYSENALRIYENPIPRVSSDEIASGFTGVSAIYESMNEFDLAIDLLDKALKIYGNAPRQQNAIAGIEAQIGVMYYLLENYSASYSYLKSAVSKLRAIGEKKSASFGLALNQMGLVCVHCDAIQEAVRLFKEAKGVLEQEWGPYHPNTLGVCNNLSAAYDAIDREGKLGTANPEVEEEKRRYEAARLSVARETLWAANSHTAE